MKEIKSITRKWGNPTIVVITNKVLAKENLKENIKITINVQKRPKAGVL